MFPSTLGVVSPEQNSIDALCPRSPNDHRPRLISKHPPMKENMPTTMPIAMLAVNGGECAASLAFI